MGYIDQQASPGCLHIHLVLALPGPGLCTRCEVALTKVLGDISALKALPALREVDVP
jgi:hypothetical protein